MTDMNILPLFLKVFNFVFMFDKWFITFLKYIPTSKYTWDQPKEIIKRIEYLSTI